MTRMQPKNVGLLVVIALASALVATPAAAFDKNPCMKGWTGPSNNNSLNCPTSGSEIQTFFFDSGLVYCAVPIVIGFLTLFPGCCVFICGRYCCQCLGGSKMRPASTCCECCCGNPAYDQMPEEEKINLYPMYSTVIVKGLTAACFIVCAVALILGVLGGLDTKKNAQSTVIAFGDGFQVFIKMADDLNASIRDPNNASKVPDGFDASIFDSFKTDMLKQKKDFTDILQPFADGMETYALIPAFVLILPTLCLLFAVAAAVFSVRDVLPLLIILGNFLLQFLFFFVASLILFVLFPAGILCDEVNAGPNEKGVLNWMLIPECEDINPLKDLNDQVNQMEKEGSQKACGGLLDICDTNTVWNIATKEKIFVCNLTASTDCNDFATVSGTLNAMYLKTGASVYESCSGISPCTVQNCSTSCVNNDTKNYAVTAIDSVNTVTRVLAAFRRIIGPFLSCRKLFDLVLNSGPKQGCTIILRGLRSFKDGLLMCGAACWASIFILFLGQKRFSCPNASQAPSPLEDGDSYNAATAKTSFGGTNAQPNYAYTSNPNTTAGYGNMYPPPATVVAAPYPSEKTAGNASPRDAIEATAVE